MHTAIAIILAVLLPPQAQRAAAPAPSDLLVSMEWLRDHAADPNVTVLEIGMEGPDFARGHIPGAIFLSHMATLENGHRLLEPAKLASVLAAAGVRDAAHIVVYGDHPMSAGWGFMALASIGHGDHTSFLDGNLKSWKAAGYPVATGKTVVPAGRLSVKPAPGVAVDGPWVRAHLDDPSIRLLDVREDDEWKQGMIPNAHRFVWEDLYADVAAGRLKTPSAIREVFERAGVGAGQTAVPYCAVGMRASVAYVAARVAGIPVSVYTGSMKDWTSRAGYPLAK